MLRVLPCVLWGVFCFAARFPFIPHGVFAGAQRNGVRSRFAETVNNRQLIASVRCSIPEIPRVERRVF